MRDAALPDAFPGLHVVARATINLYERAACMAFFWDHQREQLSPQMRRYIETGHKISRDEYLAGLAALEECRALLRRCSKNSMCLLCLASRRSAQGSRCDRRSQHAGDLDRAAHAIDDASDPSRAQ